MTNGADIFENERRRLFGLAYRLLGSVADAEDVLQDAFLRWQGTDQGTVRKPAALLTTIVSRLAIDRLRAQKRRRETYVGPWLPDPLPETAETGQSQTAASPEEQVRIADDLTVAFLLILDTLSPHERAAFVLHDIFAMPFAEIAGLIEISEPAARQHASRARKRLKNAPPHSPPPRSVRDRMTKTFFECFQNGDLDRLAGLLTDDVQLVSDGGARGRAALRPMIGKADVMALLRGLLWRKLNAGISAELTPVQLNCRPGCLARLSDGSTMTMSLDLSADGISAIYVQRNPDKLRHLPTGESP